MREAGISIIPFSMFFLFLELIIVRVIVEWSFCTALRLYGRGKATVAQSYGWKTPSRSKVEVFHGARSSGALTNQQAIPSTVFNPGWVKKWYAGYLAVSASVVLSMFVCQVYQCCAHVFVLY